MLSPLEIVCQAQALLNTGPIPRFRIDCPQLVQYAFSVIG